MTATVKIKEHKNYKVVFKHHLNNRDKFEDVVTGRGFCRLKNTLCDMGYELHSISKKNNLIIKFNNNRRSLL